MKNPILFILLTSLFSCVAPDPVTLSPEDKDIYITNKDNSVNFANYKTYAIVDSVLSVTKNANDSTGKKSLFSNEIINDINFEMLSDGFVQVGKTQNPDVGINVSVLKFSEQVPASFYLYPFPSNGFYGYTQPAFWGYPGYLYGFPAYFGYYQIEIGSISIEMIDLKNATVNPANKKLNVIWAALIAGSIADSTGINNKIISDGISGAFNQSPYLKDGK